jgi:hypothetical protein
MRFYVSRPSSESAPFRLSGRWHPGRIAVPTAVQASSCLARARDCRKDRCRRDGNRNGESRAVSNPPPGRLTIISMSAVSDRKDRREVGVSRQSCWTCVGMALSSAHGAAIVFAITEKKGNQPPAPFLSFEAGPNHKSIRTICAEHV